MIMPATIYMPGIDTDEATNGPMTQKERDQRELTAERTAGGVKIPGSAAAAKWGKDAQQTINETTSQATKDAVGNSQITGNLLKGEIDFGKDPSVRGFVMQGADVFGSMLPVVATALATRSPGAGAAVGGSMAAGEGVGNARDFIAKQTDEDLMKHSPLYARMINAGASPEEARKIVSARAEDTAGVLQGLVASMGDHFTGKLVTGALDPVIAKIAGKTVAGKVAAGTAMSSLEEGAQELTEGLASDLGTKSVAANKEIGEDSAANFVLGAIGGSAPGAARGAVAGVKERRAAVAPDADGKDTAAPESGGPTAAPVAPPAEGALATEAPAESRDQVAGSPAAPGQEEAGGGAVDPSATQRLAELEVIDSTTGLSPEQQAERATLAQQIEEQAARETELEEVGESPEAAAAVAERAGQEASQNQEVVEDVAPGAAFDPATVQAKTWPQFVLERGEKVSTLRKGTPMWNQLQTEWSALKTHRAGVNAEGTGAVGAPTMEIQNRDRSRPASVVQMQAMAQDPDYMRLGPSRSPESGAPMVFANGDQTQAVPAIGNSDTAVMSDGQRVPLETFDSGALDSAANRDFARAFIGKLQQQGQDVAGMLDAGGGLSPAGATRLQAALVHKAYGDGEDPQMGGG